MTAGIRKAEDGESLRSLATQCRRLARGVTTRDLADCLNGMAEDYDRKAEAAAIAKAGPKPSDPTRL
jgi:hypothetical protein